MKVGERYRSETSAAQIIVMRAPNNDVEVMCAGATVVPLDSATPEPPSASAPTDSDDVLLVGKRYVDEQSGLEVLCTAAGLGPLSVDGRRLTSAAAKLLPSSD